MNKSIRHFVSKVFEVFVVAQQFLYPCTNLQGELTFLVIKDI